MPSVHLCRSHTSLSVGARLWMKGEPMLIASKSLAWEDYDYDHGDYDQYYYSCCYGLSDGVSALWKRFVSGFSAALSRRAALLAADPDGEALAQGDVLG